MLQIDDVLDFWFGPGGKSDAAARERLELWFGGSEETDRLIRERFAADLERAAAGGYDTWVEGPRGALALIILLDQFPRNIHRGSPRAYACDERSLALCLSGMARRFPRCLSVVERAFFFLPLEHAEDLRMQNRSVRAFEELLNEAPPASKKLCAGFLDYAVRHREIIERFGRFPHRNAVLGRPSTPEEEAFLREPGSSF